MTFAQPFQDYEILDRVGAGAMGTVFKARHKKLNRIVALKVLKPSLARDRRYVDRLRREARIVASLNHPNIVTGYDLGEEGGYHFFVMEFVEGKSLRALLVEWGMFAEEYVRAVARQVAQALDHAYHRGVIHRDIKPGNILIDEKGDVKLTDMGLAKGPADMTLTRDGATVGTPQYISPEQARNPQDVDVRSDLYSLGATLYHMATGVPPFRGDTMAELITKVLQEIPVPPIELNPALSPGLSLVLRKLLAKDLRVRYQTPRQLLDDLDLVERQQLPQVDVDTLSAGASRRSSLWLRSAVVAGVAALLALAVLIGMQLRDQEPAPPTADEYLARLDAELQTLATPGARLERLRASTAAPPSGSAAQLLQRERAVLAELQASVDGAVAEFLERRWPELQSWFRDPTVWPDRQRCERERIGPRLREVAGVSLGHLPQHLRTLRIDELSARVDRDLAQRDQELLSRFDVFLTSTLPARAEERARAGDFAAAGRLWRDALSTFCDGVHMPLPERLSPAVAQAAGDLYQRAWRSATEAMDRAEGAVADAMRAEVEAVASTLAERLAGGEDPDLVASAIGRLRQDLAQVWPAQGRFRLGLDPWPEIERRLGVAQQAVVEAAVRRDAQRFASRLDLVLRTYCHGCAEDALAVLSGVAAVSPGQAQTKARLGAVLEAARAVELAVVEAVARATPSVVAFPRSGPAQTVELHADRQGGGLRLMCQGLGQPVRAARLTEFRFGDLLTRLRAQGADPLQGVPREHAAAGTALLVMVGDDLAGMGTLLKERNAADGGFLVDEVWPRILRVRNEQPEVILDRESLFAGLRRAREAAARTGELNALEASLLTCQTRLPAATLSEGERSELRAVASWLSLERRRRNTQAELSAGAPAGAEVRVSTVGDELAAEVEMGARVLHRDAADGWHLRDGLLEFAGGDRPWSEMPLQVLRCSPGIEPTAARTTLQLDFVVPPSSAGRRLYVVEFRGIAVLLTIAANDGVHAALVDGDPRREELAQRAFQRAMLGGLSPPRVLAVPGAVHRLTMEIVASSTRRRAMVKASFEDVVLLEESHDLDAQQPPSLLFYSQQEVSVRSVVVRALGL